MATKQQFQDAFNVVNTALSNIGDDITRLTERLTTAGMTDAEEAEVLAELTALGDRAKAIADVTPEDTVPEPEA